MSTQLTQDRGVKLTYFGLAICAILAFGAFMRLSHLGYMAYHHDESIHAWYSFRLYDLGRFINNQAVPIDTPGNVTYLYDPVYHGPFLYHHGALYFWLFGDSDFTGRLPFAVFGILMLVLIYQMHHLIGKTRASIALFFAAISPTLIYFSRFARNDVYIGTDAVGTILFALLYLRSGKARWFFGMVAWYTLAYCTKENSYILGFQLCSFVVLAGLAKILWDGFMKGDWVSNIRRYVSDRFEFTALVLLYGIYSVTVFTYIAYPFHVENEKSPFKDIQGDISRQIARSRFQDYLTTNPSFTWLMLAGAILAALILVGVMVYLRLILEERKKPAEPEAQARAREKDKDKDKEKPKVTITEEDRFAPVLRGGAWLLLALFLVFFIYSFFFTTMYANVKDGIIDGCTDYVRYWYVQKYKPRIAQEDLGKLYFFFPLIIYEIAPLIIGILGIGYYGVRFALRIASAFMDSNLDYKDADKTDPPFIIPLFLSWWALTSLVIYANLHERVPWLMVHQALPLTVLAGYFVGDLWIRFSRWYSRIPLAFGTIFLSIFVFRAAILLIFYNPDNPEEVMVYVQSNENVRKIMREIDEVAFISGKGNKLSVGIRGEAQWPFSWYLRNYQSAAISKANPVNIADVKDHGRLKVVLGEEFESMKYGFRAHWSPDRNRLEQNKWGNYWTYFIQRKPWNDTGAAELMFYRKRQIRDVFTDAEACAPGFELSPRPGNFVKSWGGPGVENGRFRSPRGLALAPDGSLYVVDSGNARVQKFSPDGEHLLTVGGGSRGEGTPGLFSEKYTGPCGVACDSAGNVYVTDTWGQSGGRDLPRIQKFDPMGQFLSQMGPPPESFYGPRDLTVDERGNLYVSNTGRRTIDVYSATQGNFLYVLGQEGGGALEFVEQVGVAVNPQGHLVVNDIGNRRIQIIDPIGRKLVNQWNVCGWETENVSAVEAYVTVAEDGTVFATDSTRACVYQIAPDGRSVIVWGIEGSGTGQMRKPTGIAVDKDGFVYVADTDLARINKYKRY